MLTSIPAIRIKAKRNALFSSRSFANGMEAIASTATIMTNQMMYCLYAEPLCDVTFVKASASEPEKIENSKMKSAEEARMESMMVEKTSRLSVCLEAKRK